MNSTPETGEALASGPQNLRRLVEVLAAEHRLNEREIDLLASILALADQIPHLSSRNLAERIGSSSSSVLRLVRRLGYEGYRPFQYRIQERLEALQAARPERKESAPEKLALQTAAYEQGLVGLLLQELDTEILARALEAIRKADTLFLIADDANGSLAQLAAHLYVHAGLPAFALSETDMQMNLVSLARPGQVFVLLSKYGRNERFVRMARQLAEKNIPLLYIGPAVRTPIHFWTDLVLATPYPGQIDQGDELDYYVAARFYLDLLARFLFGLHEEEAILQRELVTAIFRP